MPTTLLLRFLLFLVLCTSVIHGNSQIYSRAQLDFLEQDLKTQEGIPKIKTLLYLSEGYSQFQIDTAIMYANLAREQSVATNYDWGYYKSIFCAALASTDNSPIYKVAPILKQCARWFEFNQFEQDAIHAQIAYTRCVQLLYGSAAARVEAELTLERAQALNDHQLMGMAWFDIYRYKPSMIPESKHPRSIDSALYHLGIANDSINILEAQLHKTLRINGSKKAFACSFESLKIANRWGNKRISFRAAMYVGLGYAGIRKTDSSNLYFEKSLVYANQLRSKELQMRGTQKISYGYFIGRQHEKSITYSNQALEMCEKYNYINFTSMLTSRNASCFLKLGKNETAINYLLQALEIEDKLQNQFNISTLRRMLAGLYRSTKQYEKARQTYNETLAWSENNLDARVRARTISNIYGELGHLELELGHTEQGISLLEKATAFDTIMTNRYALEAKTALITAYLDDNKLYKADSVYNYSKSIYSKRVLKQSLYFSLISGRLLIAKKNYDAGIKALYNFLDRSKSKILNSDKALVYLDLYKGYNGLGKHKEALSAFVEYKTISDSINANLATAKVSQIEANLELTIKETTISDLQKQQELQTLTLLQKENQLELRQLYIIILSFGTLLVLIIGYLVFRRYRQKKEHEKIEMKAKRAELELENLQSKQKAEISELKNVLFANVSHEFRTPLTLIQVPIQSYMEKAAVHDKPIFESVLKNTGHLLGMIDELLDLGKMQSGVVKLNHSTFELTHFFLQTESYFSPLFLEKNITCNWHYQLDNYLLKGDEKRLRIVLNNFLKNAYNHTPQNGTVTITIEMIDSMETRGISCQVKNTGKGILKEDIPRVFERYYRSNETDYVGNGIGLSLCKQIIDMHQGEIGVNVNNEKEVTFYFTLPGTLITAEKTDTIIETGETELANNLTAETNERLPHLLIVEDNSEMRALLNSVLKTEFNLAFAENGVIGEQKTIELQPELVISDVMMPKKNGFMLLNDLKTNIATSHIPIILLTAKSDSNSRVTGFEQDADDYISKPFDPKELKARIYNLLRQRKKLQQRFSENPFIRSKDVKCTPLDAVFIDKTKTILEKEFANGDFGVAQFCEALALNRNSVHNKLKALTDQNTSQYIKSFRLEKAIKILLETNVSITDIYVDTGFNSPQTFNKAFKEKFKLSPTEYRAKNRL